MKIKMLVTDIDGTIYNKQFFCSDKIKKCFKKLCQQGIKVVLATGRMYRATVPIARELELQTPVISYQGALIRNQYHNDDILNSITTSKEHTYEIINFLRKKKVHTNLYLNDNLYVESDDVEIASYCNQRYIKYTLVNSFDELHIDNVNKILAINHDENITLNLTHELQEKYKDELYIIRSTPYFCEISNPKATKGNAVKFLADYWEIKKDEIMAVGDQDNDISLLLSAGIKVAMGNATQNLMDIADFVTETVDNDGIIVAVEKFIQI